jgi:hypothetical protein
MKNKHRIIGEYATKRCFFDLKRGIEVQYLPNRTMQDICRGSVGPLERPEGSATRPNSR